MHLAIVSAALPPSLDGIGDYTACLARELAKEVKVTILTGERSADRIPNVAVERLFDVHQRSSVRAIATWAKVNQPDWLLIQYNPFSYGRWGFNPFLPCALRAVTLYPSKTRLAVMVHETFMPATSWKRALMSVYQRWQLRQSGCAADALFFSIEPWTEQFREWFPGKRVLHLPVGSNVPRCPVDREVTRSRFGLAENEVVLGLFGTAGGGKLLDYVRAAGEGLRAHDYDVRLLYIGPDGRTVASAIGDLPMMDCGPLAAESTSEALKAVDIFCAAFIDGVSTRRGTLMAGLAHGLPIAGTKGKLTDESLRTEDGNSMLLSDVGSPESFVANVLRLAESESLRHTLGEAAFQVYETNFSWERIAGRLLEGLRGIEASSLSPSAAP